MRIKRHRPSWRTSVKGVLSTLFVHIFHFGGKARCGKWAWEYFLDFQPEKVQLATCPSYFAALYMKVTPHVDHSQPMTRCRDVDENLLLEILGIAGLPLSQATAAWGPQRGLHVTGQQAMTLQCSLLPHSPPLRAKLASGLKALSDFPDPTSFSLHRLWPGKILFLEEINKSHVLM